MDSAQSDPLGEIAANHENVIIIPAVDKKSGLDSMASYLQDHGLKLNRIQFLACLGINLAG